MKKIIGLILVASALTLQAAQFTWDGGHASSGSFAEATNWAGDVAPSANSDTIILSSNTGRACSVKTSKTIGKWLYTSTDQIVFPSGVTVTSTVGGFIFNGGGAIIVSGATITLTGSGDSLFVSAGGTISSASTTINYNAPNCKQIFNKAVTNRNVTVNNGSVTLSGSNGFNISSSTIASPLVISSGRVTMNVASTLFNTTGNPVLSMGANDTLNGTGAVTIRTGSNIPAITYTGSGAWSISATSSTSYTDSLTGNLSLGGNALTIGKGSTGKCKFYANGYTITCGAFNLTNSSATDTAFVFLDGSTLNCNSKITPTSVAGVSVFDLGSATINCSGSWTNGTSANEVLVHGTSRVTVDSISTITSSNEHFYNFRVSVPSSGAVTLADSLTILNDFVDTLGKFKTAGFNLNLSGDFYRYSQDSMLASTSIVTLNKANALWKKLAGTGAPVGGMAQSTMRAINGARFDIDTNMTVYRLVSAASKKLQFAAGRIFKDSTYTSGDLNNDTLQSLTGGSKAYLNLPANTPLTDSWIKDIFAINTIYDTVSIGLNGGNDSNIVFKYASGIYARSPTTVTVTSASPASVPIAGGTLDTITGTGFYPPCSVSIGGSYIGSTYIDTTKISFTTPASTAGLKLVTVKNGDFKTGAGSVLTYTGTTTPTIDSIRPAGGIFGTQVTVRGHTFGASPSGYLNGALVPYVSRSDTTYVFNVTDIPERGNVPVVIVNNTYDTRDTIQFFIFYNPQLASVTPNHGKTVGGDTVEIRCDSCGAVDTVWFQNDPVIPFSVTDSLVKAIAPAHAATTVYVAISDTNGYVDTLQAAYEYNNLYGWTVTHPSSLDTAGGDTIKFHSEYGQVTANTIFTFDGSVVALTTNTDTLSTYITPAHVKGSVPWIFDAFGTVKTGSVRYGATGQRRRLFNFGWGAFRF